MKDILPIEVLYTRYQAQLKHDHARKCDGTMTVKVKGKKEKVPCTVCAANVKWFFELPAITLSQVLQEHPRVSAKQLNA